MCALLSEVLGGEVLAMWTVPGGQLDGGAPRDLELGFTPGALLRAD